MKIHLLGSSLRARTIKRKVVNIKPSGSRIRTYRQRAPSVLRILQRARPPGIGTPIASASSLFFSNRQIKRIKDRATRMRPVTKGKKPGPGIPDLRIP
jgi:hypothetical protein